MDNKYLLEIISCIENTVVTVLDEGMEYDYEYAIKIIIEEFLMVREHGGMICFAGNGGSAAIASHMTADYMKNGHMNTCSLYDAATITCMSNDYGYEYAFSRQLELLMRGKDLLVTISSSGNSQNIINAINVARSKGAKVITFTGFKENNSARQLGDINVWIPCERYGIVESIHNLMLQQIVDMIMEKDGVSI